jgi:negative regulator of flagellin synthesis FlgM
MKIDSSVKSGSSATVAGGAARLGKGTSSTTGNSGTAGASASGAHVQLSQFALQMQAIESGMADTPVVDSARVTEIRRAIAEGSFKVNPDMVADKLIQTARELMRVRFA